MFFGSIVSILTPFTKSLQVDHKALEELIQGHIQERTQGIVCFGSFDEFFSLSDEEKEKILDTCAKASQGKIKIIAGVFTEKLDETLLFLKKIKKLKVDGALIAIPKSSINNPTSYFEEISKLELPIIAYNVQSIEKRSLEPFVCESIANIKNVVAINEGSKNLKWIEELSKRTDIPILVGHDMLALSGFQCGAKGVISHFANLLPSIWNKMIAYAQEKKFQKAFEIFEPYKKLTELMYVENFSHTIKYAASLQKKSEKTFRTEIKISPLLQEQVKEELRILKLL